MIKEIVAYILVGFGVGVAITGTVFYLRTYKTMFGQTSKEKNVEADHLIKSEE